MHTWGKNQKSKEITTIIIKIVTTSTGGRYDQEGRIKHFWDTRNTLLPNTYGHNMHLLQQLDIMYIIQL